jgi:predicted transporter
MYAPAVLTAFGILAGLSFLSAAAIAMNRKMRALRRLRLHHLLAGSGLIAMVVHGILVFTR